MPAIVFGMKGGRSWSTAAIFHVIVRTRSIALLSASITVVRASAVHIASIVAAILTCGPIHVAIVSAAWPIHVAGVFRMRNRAIHPTVLHRTLIAPHVSGWNSIAAVKFSRTRCRCNGWTAMVNVCP